ncbi:hypothetical protein [Corynebacterium doosanense]|uniref:hypothetical protein n=1 Tax=Corynebacterium doosanense TaxID=1121358 RepID=UPI0012DF43B6|nr:hypothetical protein [Corynebacterium doosanense]
MAFAEEELAPQLSDDSTADVHPETITVTLPERNLTEVEHTLDAYGSWLGEFRKKLDGAQTPDLEVVAGEGLRIITLGPDGKDATVAGLPLVDRYIEQGGSVVLRDTKDHPSVLLAGNEEAVRQLVQEIPEYYFNAVYPEIPIVGGPDQFDDRFTAHREQFEQVKDLSAAATAAISARKIEGIEVVGVDGHYDNDAGELAADVDLRTDSETPGGSDPDSDLALFDLFEGSSEDHGMGVVGVGCRVGNRAMWPTQYRDE